MHLIIATDEAGYGPKLGPLVIVATAWKIPSKDVIDEALLNLSVPCRDNRCGAVFVDDSKKVFKRNVSLAHGRESLLDVTCRAASTWAQLPDPLDDLPSWLSAVAPLDVETMACIPWYAESLQGCGAATMASTDDRRCSENDQAILDHWSSHGLQLSSIQARVLTASAFNQMVNLRKNKADILTECTCGLVHDLISSQGQAASNVSVFSDRHGGRAYYGAALQQQFPDSAMRVLFEEKHSSKYALGATTRCGDVEWSFTVSGDSFAPVAMSSMIAKWVREQAMDRFNQFFQRRLPAGAALAPTAGYPVDAIRYLDELQRWGLRDDISDDLLIRKR